MSVRAIEAAVYVVLNDATVTGAPGNATGGVHRQKAPHGDRTATVVIYAFDDGVPARTLAGPVWEDTEFTVRAICQGLSADPADVAYETAHGLLENAALAISGMGTMFCRRIALLSYDEDGEGGLTYQHVGGRYRIMATT